jgi:hypothetical protein
MEKTIRCSMRRKIHRLVIAENHRLSARERLVVQLGGCSFAGTPVTPCTQECDATSGVSLEILRQPAASLDGESNGNNADHRQ